MSMEIEFLKGKIEELNDWTKAYDEGHPIVSDKEWDDAYFELMSYEQKYNIYLPESPTQCVNFEVVSQLNKVEHEYPMLSLDKTKDWNEFLRYFDDKDVSKDVVGMIKLDGLTCSLTYELGYLTKAETRGNGLVGEDILHNAKVIHSIPKRISCLDKLVVHGEIICTDRDFEEFEDEYANSRNFASGSIRLLDAKECANRKLTFVLWNVVEGLAGNSFISKLQQAEVLGFTIVPWTSSFDWDAREFLVEQAKTLGYPIDGLVGRFNDIVFGTSLGSTGHHSRAAYAFKFYDETYPTHMLDIEWTMGRTGVLTPVAVFEPIEIEGSIVERASLHNYSVMIETLNGGSWVGQEISVFKANMIIPQIADADGRPPKGAKMIRLPEVCPVCGGPIIKEVSDSGTINFVCDNPKCEGKLINSLDHFCGKKGLDIKGLSKATLEKLIDWGWITNILDLYSLEQHRTEWENKPGFGVKSVGNILAAIENSKNCELYSFISAIGIPLIGSTYAKEIARHEDDWAGFREKVNKMYDFASWEGFGSEMCYWLWNFDYAEADLLVKILHIANSFSTVNNTEQNSSSSLEGITVCVTGKLNLYKNRAELQSKIEKCGGKVTGSVSKNTNYLINNDNTSTSAKNVSATKLGIPVVTEQEFFEKFLKNS